MTFFFSIALVINGQNSHIISTDFQDLNSQEYCFKIFTQDPNLSIDYQGKSEIQWCTDSSCSMFYVPELPNLNDTFYMQHSVINNPDIQQYYLTGTTVYYVGDGLNKLTSPISIENSIPGQVTLLLTAELLWNNVAFQVTSYLSTTMTGGRRIMQSATTPYDPVSATTISLMCIKLPSSQTCPTCAEQCEANGGIADSSCPECLNSFNLSFIFMNILIFINI